MLHVGNTERRSQCGFLLGSVVDVANIWFKTLEVFVVVWVASLVKVEIILSTEDALLAAILLVIILYFNTFIGWRRFILLWFFFFFIFFLTILRLVSLLRFLFFLISLFWRLLLWLFILLWFFFGLFIFLGIVKRRFKRISRGKVADLRVIKRWLLTSIRLVLKFVIKLVVELLVRVTASFLLITGWLRLGILLFINRIWICTILTVGFRFCCFSSCFVNNSLFFLLCFTVTAYFSFNKRLWSRSHWFNLSWSWLFKIWNIIYRFLVKVIWRDVSILLRLILWIHRIMGRFHELWLLVIQFHVFLEKLLFRRLDILNLVFHFGDIFWNFDGFLLVFS